MRPATTRLFAAMIGGMLTLSAISHAEEATAPKPNRNKKPAVTQQQIEDLFRAFRAKDYSRARKLVEADARLASASGNTSGTYCLVEAAKSNRIDLVRFLLAKGADPNIGAGGGTALHVATGWGNMEMAKMLLNAGAKVNTINSEDFTPFSIFRDKKMALLLRSRGGWHQPMFEDLVPVLQALDASDLKAAEEVLKKQPKLVTQKKGRKQRTVLHWAAMEGRADLVKLLLAAGADIERPDWEATANNGRKFGNTPLHIAAKWGHSEVVAVLLKAGAKIDPRENTRHLTPLHMAILWDQLDVVQQLLAAGADTRITDGWKRNPLHLAVLAGSERLVLLFLKRGADIEAQGTSSKKTPLHLAASQGHVNVAKLLIAHKEDVNKGDISGLTPLHDAATRKVAELLMAHGAKINVVGGRGQTPLHQAAHVEVAAYLLEKGAKLDAQDQYGATPLHYAVGRHHPDTAQLLIAKGADVKIQTQRGYPLLSSAVFHEDLKTAKLLLAKGADPNKGPARTTVIGWRTFSRATGFGSWQESHAPAPLWHAIHHGHEEMVELLLAHGARVNPLNHGGPSPLHLAIERRHLAIAKRLLDKGADVNARDGHGATPLHGALRYYRDESELVKLLIRHGAELNTLNVEGFTPLASLLPGKSSAYMERSAKDEWVRIERFLPKQHAFTGGVFFDTRDSFASDKEKMSAFLRRRGAESEASHEEITEISKALAAKNWDQAKSLLGANPLAGVNLFQNALTQLDWTLVAKLLETCPTLAWPGDANGWLPIHDAAAANSVAIVKQLLAIGVDVDANTTDGHSALHLAAEFGHLEMAQLLLSSGAYPYARRDSDSMSPREVAEQHGQMAVAELLEKAEKAMP